MRRSQAPSQRGKRAFVSPLLASARASTTATSSAPSKEAAAKRQKIEAAGQLVENQQAAKALEEEGMEEETEAEKTKQPANTTSPAGARPRPLGVRRSFSPVAASATSSAAPRPSTSLRKAEPAQPKVANDGSSSAEEMRFFRVMWCKFSRKKHKTYNDGVLVIKEGKVCILKDMQAKEIGKTASYPAKELVDLGPGNSLCFSGKELEILEEITADNYQSGAVFLDEVEVKGASKPASAPKPRPATKFKPHSSVAGGAPVIKELKPRHPITEDSLVLFNPTAPSDANGPLVAVVVDPYLSNVLQPHQKEGVRFMYECTMGLRGPGRGCILADEMGLGKTLQAITLVWTLLRQGPNGVPATKKAIVVTPTSLTRNWHQEVKRWLGLERLHALVIGQAAAKKEETVAILEEFKNSPLRPLLIISYEQFRIHASFLQSVAGVDLIICDEGHRLKNSEARITKSINGMETRRRVIITGTPIQNDLEEFFTMVNFCNPGFMDLKKFRDVFATPILLGRDPNATPQQRLESESRSAALSKRTENFIIRRTKDLLRQYLPPRVEQVVFCRLSSLQVDLYKQFLRSTMVSSVISSGQQAAALSCIISLRKLCNHPSSICPKTEAEDEIVDADMKRILALLPEGFSSTNHALEYSGKMMVLDKLLEVIRTTTKDRVVIVSNFKQALDVIQTLCKMRSYKFLRLDGSTAKGQRQTLVDHFNDQTSDYFVFLLSSKAGNVGFNLVGSNRIVLFDPDWNPANDAQAMGRVWRYGQKKKCWIYRFASTGTIEEKIFQRQIAKEGLSNAVVDAGRMAADATKARFTREELRDIFTYNEFTLCDTHDLFGCECIDDTVEGKRSTRSAKRRAEKDESKVAVWEHRRDSSTFEDPVLQMVGADTDLITFVFQKQTQKDLDVVDDLAPTAGSDNKDASEGSENELEESETAEAAKDHHLQQPSDEGSEGEDLEDDLLRELETDE